MPVGISDPNNPLFTQSVAPPGIDQAVWDSWTPEQRQNVINAQQSIVAGTPWSVPQYQPTGMNGEYYAQPQHMTLPTGQTIQDPWSTQQQGIDSYNRAIAQQADPFSFSLGTPLGTAAVVLGGAAAGGAFGGSGAGTGSGGGISTGTYGGSGTTADALTGVSVPSGVAPMAGGTGAATDIGSLAAGGLQEMPAVSSGFLPGVQSFLGNYGSLISGGLGLLGSLSQPDSSTQSTSYQLPPQVQGALNQGVAGLQDVYNQGYQVAPLGGLFGQTQDTLGNILSGDTINPYLDTTFNAAADATQNRLATEFAQAGRLNSGANQQARSQELQQLAAGIYGPGYENAMNRQLQAIQPSLFSSVLGQQNAQQTLDAPYTNAQRYLSGLNQVGATYRPTVNTTTPLYNNPLAGFLGGYLTGQSLFG